MRSLTVEKPPIDIFWKSKVVKSSPFNLTESKPRHLENTVSKYINLDLMWRFFTDRGSLLTVKDYYAWMPETASKGYRPFVNNSLKACKLKLASLERIDVAF